MPRVFTTISIPNYLFSDQQLRDLIETATDVQGNVVAKELPAVVEALLQELDFRGNTWEFRDGRFVQGTPD